MSEKELPRRFHDVLEKRSELALWAFLESFREHPWAYQQAGPVFRLRGSFGGTVGAKLDAFADAFLVSSGANWATQEVVDTFNALWRYIDPKARNEDGVVLKGAPGEERIEKYIPPEEPWSRERILRSVDGGGD